MSDTQRFGPALKKIAENPADFELLFAIGADLVRPLTQGGIKNLAAYSEAARN
jgi:hypothetical protein